MSSILCWNARGLHSTDKRRYLKEILYDNKIDIFGIKETKVEKFSDRILNNLNTNINFGI